MFQDLNRSAMIAEGCQVFLGRDEAVRSLPFRSLLHALKLREGQAPFAAPSAPHVVIPARDPFVVHAHSDFRPSLAADQGLLQLQKILLNQTLAVFIGVLKWFQTGTTGGIVYLRRSISSGASWLKTLRSRGHIALRETCIWARKRARLTTRGLAERIGQPNSYVTKVEKGERKIDPVECVSWAEGCRITPLAFFWHFVRQLRNTP